MFVTNFYCSQWYNLFEQTDINDNTIRYRFISHNWHVTETIDNYVSTKVITPIRGQGETQLIVDIMFDNYFIRVINDRIIQKINEAGKVVYSKYLSNPKFYKALNTKPFVNLKGMFTADIESINIRSEQIPYGVGLYDG